MRDESKTWYMPGVWLGLTFGPLDLKRDPVVLQDLRRKGSCESEAVAGWNVSVVRRTEGC